MPVLTSGQQERKSKQRKIRNSEYYDMEGTFDRLYAESKKDKTFNHLMEIIESEENIKLAYRTIKKNTGSDTSGVDKRTIADLAKLSEEEYVRLIRKQFSNYHPRPVRRVEIPKPNGKSRPLGIPTIVDRIVQQCILQVMEPICEAKFSENSNGFRPNRSAETAIAQCMRLIQVQHRDLAGYVEVPEQTDLWIAYDYRTLAFEEAFAPYKEVHLVAWSLGVWVATRLWAGHRSFTTATALNGTPFPMHDTLGIPTAIFEGTLHHISEEGMRRFNRRMCGDKETFNRYSELSPRPLEEIKEELESLYNQILPEKLESADPRISTFWDQAILSTEDKIFPATNLRNYWQGRCPIQEIKAPHLPFYHYQSWNEFWK